VRSVPAHAGDVAAAAQRAFLPRWTGFDGDAVARPYNPGMVTESSQVLDSRPSVRRTLEQHGIRPTAQRVRMAEVMLAAPCHMTAEQVLAALRRSAARVSKATVYNTLKLFVERGLVRQVHLDPNRCVYDSTREPHHHFQNLDTGEMIDIGPEELAFARMPALPPGTEIAGVDVVIRLRRRA
jgi:Fur family transcriptional regulator, iron response regulator